MVTTVQDVLLIATRRFYFPQISELNSQSRTENTPLLALILVLSRQYILTVHHLSQFLYCITHLPVVIISYMHTKN